MSRLGRVSGETVEALLNDFLERLGGTAGLVGGYHAAKRLLGALSADKVDAILDDIRGPVGRTVWDKLGNVDENVLAAYLKNEYPRPSLSSCRAFAPSTRACWPACPKKSRSRRSCACCASSWCKRTC